MLTVIWVAAVLFIIIVFLSSSIVVGLHLTHGGSELEGQVNVRAVFGIVRISRELHEVHPKWTSEGPALKTVHDKVKDKPQETTLTASEVWRMIRHWNLYTSAFQKVSKPLRRVLKDVLLVRCDCEMNVGTGDAVSTGCAIGLLWSALGLVVGELSNLTHFTARPKLVINPDFNGTRFDASFDCIGRIRVGKAIVGAVRVFSVWKGIQKTMFRPNEPRKEEKIWSTPSRG